MKALVTGAGGFIGHHLVRKLRAKGYWVRGADIKHPEYCGSDADEFVLTDLREYENCKNVVSGMDEVYNLAADMGGMGFIHSAPCEIMRNNSLINNNMLHAATMAKVPRYFFSSSVCVYRDMKLGEPELDEAGAYPANPDNDYGWEKLFAERMAMAYEKHYGIQTRIARFQNCYGAEGTWTGGREKAPAAFCRKVAEVESGGTVEMWGDGTAVRSFIHVRDMVDAIYTLMHSDLHGAVNIGCPEYVDMNQLAEIVAKVAGKKIKIQHIVGPVGVQSRNFNINKILSTGWVPKIFLEEGIGLTYPWVESQVTKAQNSSLAGGEDDVFGVLKIK